MSNLVFSLSQDNVMVILITDLLRNTLTVFFLKLLILKTALNVIKAKSDSVFFGTICQLLEYQLGVARVALVSHPSR